MTEWGVVGVLVVLIGLVASITKPLINLTTTINKLTNAVNLLQEKQTETKDKVREFSEERKARDERVANRLDHHDKTLMDHEHRITALEEK